MILLLGGGYTLSRLAKKLNPKEFIITSTNPDKVKTYINLGYNSVVLDLNKIDLKLEVDLVIDSIPPTIEHIKKLEIFYKSINTKKVIYLSTTGVFGYQNGELVNEESECHPLHSSGFARLEVENFYKNQNFKTCSLRLPAIYGSGRGIGLALKNQRMPLVNEGNRYSNRIHVDDLVGILSKLIEIQNLPEVICINDQKIALVKDVVDFYCSKFNLEYPKSISLEEAIKQGFYHSISNQRIDNTLVNKLINYNYLYPSYLDGAGSEFE